MDFRELAAKETSELAARLTKAAATAAEAAAKRAADDERKITDGVRQQLQSAVKDKTATAALLKDAQTLAERLRAELKTATERLETACASRDEQGAARRTAEADLRKTRETVDSLRAELASAMKTLEKAAAEHLAAEEAAAEATSQSQAAEAKLAAVTELLKKSASRVKTLEQGHEEHERSVQDLEKQLDTARAVSVPAGAPSTAVLDDLLASFQALSAAATIGEVLTTLVEQMAAQFPRVALFRVKKGHLQGEQQIGFDLKTDIAKLMLPLGMDSLPSRAASSGQMETLTGDELKDYKRSPFSGSPHAAIAMPLVVSGETLAILYADDSGAAPRARGTGGDDVTTRYAEAMQQYSVALLARLTNELKALGELQRYATSLLHEIEQMYEADAQSGVTGAELRKRLAGNLEYARSIYGSRAALENADAANLIDDEIAALIDARKSAPFAADLAAAAGTMPRATAEAS